MNTDPHDMPGTYWIALWTCGNMCEVLDSYALPLEVYPQTTVPLEEWLNTRWKHVVDNEQSLQSFRLATSQPHELNKRARRAVGNPCTVRAAEITRSCI